MPNQNQIQKGYHLQDIQKGVYGHLSKIAEEVQELDDAREQDSQIMMLVELSDLYGAIEAYAESLGSSMEELRKMSDITKRAFLSGQRR
jgi:NTP pyrophosphatase (non-canonical NTP hydrolase)